MYILEFFQDFPSFRQKSLTSVKLLVRTKTHKKGQSKHHQNLDVGVFSLFPWTSKLSHSCPLHSGLGKNPATVSTIPSLHLNYILPIGVVSSPRLQLVPPSSLCLPSPTLASLPPWINTGAGTVTSPSPARHPSLTPCWGFRRQPPFPPPHSQAHNHRLSSPFPHPLPSLSDETAPASGANPPINPRKQFSHIPSWRPTLGFSPPRQ